MIKLQEYNGWDLVWIEESNLGSEGFAHIKGPEDKCERSQNVYIYSQSFKNKAENIRLCVSE